MTTTSGKTWRMAHVAVIGGILAAVFACNQPGNDESGTTAVGLSPSPAAGAARIPGAAGAPAEPVPFSEPRIPGRLLVFPAGPDGTPGATLATSAADPADLGCACSTAHCRCKTLPEGRGYVCETSESEDCSCTCAAGPVVSAHRLMGGGTSSASTPAPAMALTQKTGEEGAP